YRPPILASTRTANRRCRRRCIRRQRSSRRRRRNSGPPRSRTRKSTTARPLRAPPPPVHEHKWETSTSPYLSRRGTREFVTIQQQPCQARIPLKYEQLVLNTL